MPARFPVSRAAIPVPRRVDPEATGATRVLIFDHTVRRRVWGGVDRSAGGAAPARHGRPQRLYDQVRPATGPPSDGRGGGRIAPASLRNRQCVAPDPRAAARCTTRRLRRDDRRLHGFCPLRDLVYRDRTGEIYRVSYNPAHRWFYVPEMQPDEAILIKCYDSAPDKSRLTAHSAFEDRRLQPMCCRAKASN